MRERRQGRIILVSSGLALTAYAGYTACARLPPHACAPPPCTAHGLTRGVCRTCLRARAIADVPAKWAVRGLGDVLRTELKPDGITVHQAYPGNMNTPGYEVENQTKPPETKAIEAGETLYEPGHVVRPPACCARWGGLTCHRHTLQARCICNSVMKGEYHVACGDLGISLLARSVAGAAAPASARPHAPRSRARRQACRHATTRWLTCCLRHCWCWWARCARCLPACARGGRLTPCAQLYAWMWDREVANPRHRQSLLHNATGPASSATATSATAAATTAASTTRAQ